MLCFGRQSPKDSSAPPFPMRQMLVLALCRLCEPIAFMSIFPYIYYMIESFHMTDDNRKIALFAGLVTSVFAFCEFLCGIPWGWASDRFGRKPILLTGLAGTGISMIVFGLAPNFATALIARALGGLLNGNIGVIHTTVGEVVTVEKHQARGYSIIPMVWCVGSVLGSAIGGVMADPVRNYGWSEGTIWARFPFLLPNLFCTGIVVLGMVVGILFLEETHEDLKHNRDRGLEAGEWILSLFGNSPAPKLFGRKGDYTEEIFTFLHEDTDCPPDYRSTASSPELSPSAAPVGLPPPAYEYIEGLPRDSMDLEALAREAEIEKRNASLSYAFTKQVVLIIASYGILAYHTISAEQLLPVMFSLPDSETAPSLPFKFTGGFDMPTRTIGGILSVQGVIQVIAMLLPFPLLTRYLGSLTLFRITVFTYPLLYIVTPYLSLVPGSMRMPCVWFILIWKVCAQAFTMPSANILLANSIPTPKVAGTINGFMAASASLCRTFGPTVSGLLQTAGLSVGALGLPWWTNAVIAAIGAIIAIFMRDEKRRTFDNEKEMPLEDQLEHDDAITDGSNVSPDTLQSSNPSSPLLARFDRRSSAF